MPAPSSALAAAARLSGLIAMVRAKSVWTVDALVAALLPSDLDGSYAVAEPAALASILGAHTRGAQESVRAALAGIGAWTGQLLALSTVPTVPDGLLAAPADMSTVLRQTILIESKYRIGTGMDVAAALESARLRGGRAAANIGADSTRGAYTHTLAEGGMAWARVPTPAACPFCLLMASRGAVYKTKDTAQGRDGYYHPWDRCTTLAVPRGSRPGDYLDPDIGALVARADDTYFNHSGTLRTYLRSDFARQQNRDRLNTRAAGPGGGTIPPPRTPASGASAGIPSTRAGGAGGGSSDGGGHSTLRAGGSDRPTYEELVDEPGRVGIGLEWLGIDDPPESRRRQIESARLFETMYGVTVRSVKKRTGQNQSTPDLVIDEWQATLDLKNPDEPTLEAVRRALRKGRKQASHVFIDVRRLPLPEADAHVFVARALGRYPVEWLAVVGNGWKIERW